MGNCCFDQYNNEACSINDFKDYRNGKLQLIRESFIKETMTNRHPSGETNMITANNESQAFNREKGIVDNSPIDDEEESNSIIEISSFFSTNSFDPHKYCISERKYENKTQSIMLQSLNTIEESNNQIGKFNYVFEDAKLSQKYSNKNRFKKTIHHVNSYDFTDACKDFLFK